MAAPPMIDWQSPDTTPNVSPGSYEWFWVAIERHGRVVSLPATYLNAMPLDRDDSDPIERAESGNHWRNEPPGENDECVMLATGWHESREHRDYDGFYSPLLDDKATLVAWKAVAPWTKDRQPVAPSYWCAIRVRDDRHGHEPTGIVAFGMTANDANAGEAARAEVNDFINAEAHPGDFSLVLLTAAPPPDTGEGT